MKIDQCLAELESASVALQSAPESGFVNLDKIKAALSMTKNLLEAIAPRFELGERLIEDTKNSLLARLRVLKSSGGSGIISQAEKYLNSDDLEYEKLTALKQEITESINAIFGGYSKHTIKLNDRMEPPAKPEDYRC